MNQTGEQEKVMNQTGTTFPFLVVYGHRQTQKKTPSLKIRVLPGSKLLGIPNTNQPPYGKSWLTD